MREEHSEKNLSFSFFNTFTYIYAELMGRYYGGGVLELTPNEFKDLPVPYVSKNLDFNLEQLDSMVRSGDRLADILDFTDDIILHDTFGVSKKDIRSLRRIYKKLLTRRLKKNFDI